MRDDNVEESVAAKEPKLLGKTTDELLEQESQESIQEKTAQETLEQALEERDEYYDLLLRKQAEFENYKRRTVKEKQEIRRAAQAEIIGELLQVVDACQRGFESMEAEESELAGTYLEGYSLLLRQLQSVLDKYGVTEVTGVGSTFDPNVHEAVIREVSDAHGEGEILEEYRKGYLLGDKLLRPSHVKVAVQPEDVS